MPYCAPLNAVILTQDWSSVIVFSPLLYMTISLIAQLQNQVSLMQSTTADITLASSVDRL